MVEININLCIDKFVFFLLHWKNYGNLIDTRQLRDMGKNWVHSPFFILE